MRVGCSVWLGEWAFAKHPDAERWQGPCATREKAIAEALGHWGDPADGYKPCIAPCRPVTEYDFADEDWTFIIDGPVELVPLPSPNGADQPRPRE